MRSAAGAGRNRYTGTAPSGLPTYPGMRYLKVVGQRVQIIRPFRKIGGEVKRISSSIDELGAIRGFGLAAQGVSGARALMQASKVEKNPQNYASFVAPACSFTLIKSVHRTSVF